MNFADEGVIFLGDDLLFYLILLLFTSNHYSTCGASGAAIHSLSGSKVTRHEFLTISVYRHHRKLTVLSLFSIWPTGAVCQSMDMPWTNTWIYPIGGVKGSTQATTALASGNLIKVDL